MSGEPVLAELWLIVSAVMLATLALPQDVQDGK